MNSFLPSSSPTGGDHYQTEWFGEMGMSEVLKLMGKFTLAQFLAHDTSAIAMSKVFLWVCMSTCIPFCRVMTL
jgi:hypothetical protein